jgi:acyl-CoA dehydrogenase
VRAQQMAGALEHILDQSVQFALDRVQFGRPIAKFQAVQHNLAQLAGEAAAAGAAADAAAEAIAGSGIAGATVPAEVAIAKVRVGEAASTGAAIAHQVHGAMGFTREHSLHHSTRRLWAWREEFGNETYWSMRLGRMVAANGADALWPTLTQGS